jgi:hypothetical protein
MGNCRREESKSKKKTRVKVENDSRTEIQNRQRMSELNMLPSGKLSRKKVLELR